MIEKLLTKTTERKQPSSMLLYGYPKVGKSIIAAGLPGSVLYIDLEGSTDYIKSVDGKPFKRFVAKKYKDLRRLYDALEQDKLHFDFIVLDPLTEALDGVLNEMAVVNYNKYEGKDLPLSFDLSALPYGKGVKYKKNALKRFVGMLKNYTSTVVLLGHVNEKYAVGDDSMTSIKEVDLEGQLKNVVAAMTDVNGLVSRQSDTINVLKFDQLQVIAGTRFNKMKDDMVISEKLSDTEFMVYWNEVFDHLSDKPLKVELY